MSDLSAAMAGDLLRPDAPEHVDALMFLVAEAEILDADDYSGWMALVDPGIVYRMPATVTRLNGDVGDPERVTYLIDDDLTSLGLRVKRLVESPSVWAANPAPRSRRFVSNVRVRRAADGSLGVTSYLLLMRSRSDLPEYELLSAERRDLLVRAADGDLRLRAREMTLDQARLGVAHLPVPF